MQKLGMATHTYLLNMILSIWIIILLEIYNLHCCQTPH